VIETILTVLAVGMTAICLFGTIVVCYVWFLFHYQVKAIRKERELKSHHGEGN
jgi:protein-S-isoprenylcysteine O-methyltransferase Ste14